MALSLQYIKNVRDEDMTKCLALNKNTMVLQELALRLGERNEKE